MHYEDTRERMAMIDGGYVPRQEPVDEPPTHRGNNVSMGDYRLLRVHGYSAGEIDQRVNDGSINHILDRLRIQAQPAEQKWENLGLKGPKKTKSGYSVMNTVALKRALTKDSLPDAIDRLKGEMIETIREELKTKDSLETAKGLVDRAINIQVNTSQNTYFEPDEERRYEDRLDGHPGILNQFMMDVATNGGNIVSVIRIDNDVVLVHYKIPSDVIITLDNMQSR